jgi:hypothetical protein
MDDTKSSVPWQESSGKAPCHEFNCSCMARMGARTTPPSPLHWSFQPCGEPCKSNPRPAIGGEDAGAHSLRHPYTWVPTTQSMTPTTCTAACQTAGQGDAVSKSEGDRGTQTRTGQLRQRTLSALRRSLKTRSATARAITSFNVPAMLSVSADVFATTCISVRTMHKIKQPTPTSLQ